MTMLPALRKANGRFGVLRRGATCFRIVCQSCSTTTEHGQKAATDVPAVQMGAALPAAKPLSDSQPVVKQPTSAASAATTKDNKDSKDTKKASPKKKGDRANIVGRFQRMIDVSEQCWKKKPKVPAKKVPDKSKQVVAYNKWKAEFDAHEAWRKEWWWVKKRWNDCAEQAMRLDQHPVGQTLRIFNRCKQGGYVNHILLLFLVEKLMEDPKALEKFDALKLSMAANCLGMMARDSRDVGDWDKDAAWGKYVKKKQGGDDNPTNRRTEQFFTKTGAEFIKRLLEHAEKEKIIPDKLNLRDCGSITHGLGLLFPTEEGHDETPMYIRHVVGLIVIKFESEISAENALPINLSCLLHGCANLEHNGDLRRTCSAVQSSLAGGADFSEQHLSNITWALGKLGRGGETLFSLLGTRIVKNVEKFIPQGLANSVYGLGLRAGSGVQIHNTVVKALMKEVSQPQRLQRFSRQDLNSLSYGFKELGVPQHGHLMVTLDNEREKRERRHW